MGTENRERNSSGVLVDDAMGSIGAIASEERVRDVTNMDSLLCTFGRIRGLRCSYVSEYSWDHTRGDKRSQKKDMTQTHV